MDFFVRKKSDSELLTGTKIYVSRNKLRRHVWEYTYTVGLCLHDYCIEQH